jgi:glutathione synthase/RimK-type ligase-like ATP-grasp enzyme
VKTLVVLENPERWPLEIPGVEVVPARDYLTRPEFAEERGTRIFNLCRTYHYQSLGYYVSLLAAARGHRPLPSVETLQDFRLPHLMRQADDELDDLIQRSLRHLQGDEFELSIYFGVNLAERYAALARALFNLFPAPLLRARFRWRKPEKRWELERLRPIATSDIPESHREFAIARAVEYLGRPPRRQRRKSFPYELAILVDPKEPEPPSNERAIRKFVEAAEDMGIDASVIEPDEIGRIAEFDALFIRETTYVDHHSFRFSRRAEAEGLVVIDDPQSILRCTNKVFLAEAFARAGVGCPKTLVVGSGDAERIEREIGLPCVLKVPDSAFSRGVAKAHTLAEMHRQLEEALRGSELAVAQEFVSSDFDWRIGVLAGQPLWSCRYFMAKGHWQIVSRGKKGAESDRYGRTETISLDEVPPGVIGEAVRAAALVGDGLYGVDLKTAGERVLVMEVNDNPSLEAGYEDRVLGDDLYLAIMRHFRVRLDARSERTRA